jgi:acyl-CoA thioester hydrolase
MPYVHRTTVAADDIDDLAHASNVRYVQWILDAAVAHSVAVGVGQAEYRIRGHVFVVRRHEIEYLRPALVNDELDVETRVVGFTAATAERHTIIRRAADEVVLALGRSTWVLVAHASGRPQRIPEDLRSLMPAEAPSPDWQRWWPAKSPSSAAGPGGPGA